MDNKTNDFKQSKLNTWIEDGMKDTEESISSEPSEKLVPILFRNSVREIPSTTHGAFALYKYPAKFIPQVIAYVLKKYAKPNMTVFDPFAGHGTVGITARVYGYEYELWDLNPLLQVIHDTAIMKYPRINVQELMEALKHSTEEFIPKWSNLHYWFPDEFLTELSRAWGFVHALDDDDAKKHVLLIPLINVTRYFSYGDEKVHKLYKSKHSKKKVATLLKGDWKGQFYTMLEKEIRTLLKKIREYHNLNPKDVNYTIRTGVDILEARLEEDVNLLVTSPPYLQAQEYIRSTKMALYWLGHDDSSIRSLSKKEIPYRPVPRMDIHSETYHELLDDIQEDHLRMLYERYFHAILKVFSTLGDHVTDYLCIFVGPAKIRTTPIPIDEILIEHLHELGWKHEVTYIDTIVSRVMFNAKINPASGMKDSRMKTEHLVVLKKE